MAKDHYQSGEALQVRFGVFYDKTTGEPIVGTDSATYVVRRPDGSTAAAASLAFDAVTRIWHADIGAGSYQEGEWRVLATSSNANAHPQSRVLHWGGYVDDVTAAAAHVTRLPQVDLGEVRQGAGQTFVVSLRGARGVAITGVVPGNVTLEVFKLGVLTSRALTAPEIAHVAAGRYRVTLPAGDFDTPGALRVVLTDAVSGATATMIANVVTVIGSDLATTLTAVTTALTLVRQIQANRWRVDTNTRRLVIYDDDGVTPLRTFELLDDTGLPQATRVFERRPV